MGRIGAGDAVVVAVARNCLHAVGLEEAFAAVGDACSLATG
jgi:hypothetical protein